MPRIRAATVVEHREMQRRALLDAARELVAGGGIAALTFPALAKATGLARSSVYEYFKSRADVVEALVAHEFPAWIGEVRTAMAGETPPPSANWPPTSAANSTSSPNPATEPSSPWPGRNSTATPATASAPPTAGSSTWESES